MRYLICSSLQHPLKVGSVVPISQIMNLRLREVSSIIERELDGGVATDTEHRKEGDQEMKAGDRHELGSRGPQFLLAPAQLPALTLGVRSQWGRQHGQRLPREVRDAAQPIAAQPLLRNHRLSAKQDDPTSQALDPREQSLAQGHTAGWPLRVCKDLDKLTCCRADASGAKIKESGTLVSYSPASGASCW